MEKTTAIIFYLAQTVGSLISCCILEKGVSLLQNRKFNKKNAFAFFLIAFSITSLVGGAIYALRQNW